MKFTAWVPSLLRPHFHQNQACTSSNLTSLALNEKCCESKINFKAQMSAKENGKRSKNIAVLDLFTENPQKRFSSWTEIWCVPKCCAFNIFTLDKEEAHSVQLDLRKWPKKHWASSYFVPHCTYIVLMSATHIFSATHIYIYCVDVWEKRVGGSGQAGPQLG